MRDITRQVSLEDVGIGSLLPINLCIGDGSRFTRDVGVDVREANERRGEGRLEELKGIIEPAGKEGECHV